MKFSKRFLTIVFCFILMVSMFSGCAKKATTSDTTTTEVATAEDATTEAATEAESTEAESTEAVDPYATPLEISVSMWDVQDGFDAENAANDTIFNDLCKKFNITIKPVQVTGNDYKDKFKVWAASGELPDIFAIDLATADPNLYKTLAEQGIIKALPDDLSKYPNIAKVMEMPSVTPLTVGGKFYMYPRMAKATEKDWCIDRIMVYRKDWAAEAGYTDLPKDFNGYVEMAKAVMKLHPEAVGLTASNQGFYEAMFLTTFPEVTTGCWTKEGDRWVAPKVSDKVLPGLQELRTLYTEGILDPDFAIEKDNDGKQKFYSGQAFSLIDGKGVNGTQVKDIFAPANPDVDPTAAFDVLPFWPAADGNSYAVAFPPYWSESIISAKVDDEKLDRILALLDYISSDEYQLIKYNGIEGVDYKVENGVAVSLLTGDETLSTKYPITSKLGSLGSWGDFIAYTGRAVQSSDPIVSYYAQLNLAAFNKLLQDTTPAPNNFAIGFMTTDAMLKVATISSTFNAEMIKIILGTDDVAKMWGDVVKGYNDNGLQEAIDQVNVEIKEKGIE